MSSSPPPAMAARASRAVLGALAAAAAVMALGCGASHPGPLRGSELAEAQTFPYFPVYWAGPRFVGYPLTAADGLRGYIETVGDSVYYGDCVKSKGIFGGGSCELPLQVTTIIYRLHKNAALGPQRNLLLRGVPAVVYDEGRSIELYSGRTAIDIRSDTYGHALAAASRLEPINAPEPTPAPLPPPVFCPQLAGPTTAEVEFALEHLPHHRCQRDAAATEYLKQLKS